MGLGCSVSGPGLRRNVKRFRAGLVFHDYKLLHHSTLGSRAIKKKMKVEKFGGVDLGAEEVHGEVTFEEER